MNKPKNGEWFISGQDHVCQMVSDDQYRDYHYSRSTVLYYIDHPGNLFTKKCDARPEQIKWKKVIARLPVVEDFHLRLGPHETHKGFETFEQFFLLYVYKLNNGNQSKTAKALGLSRGTLIKKLKHHGISKQMVQG